MAKTAGVASAQDLAALIEKSGLLPEAALAEVKTLAAESADPKALARHLVTRSYTTKWQAAQLLNGSSKLHIGKYRLLDQIGVGRIGREFLGEHQHLGRRVAIKLVSSALTSDAGRLKQFLAESRRAVALDHPHLVHSFDVDQEGHRYYVVTEFVDGEDLNRRVKRAGPCSQSEAIDLMTQAAEGLSHAAAAEVLHGDLKPSNLIVDKQGTLKVVDLGFARLVEGASKATASRDSQDANLNDGVEYCAPEALNDVEGDFDARGDIFSLGQTLFFLLTASSPPSPAASSDERSAALLKKLPKAGKDVAKLYAQFTAPQESDRPASWTSALEQLREVSATLAKAEPQPAAAAAPPVKRKPPVATAIPETTAAESASAPAGEPVGDSAAAFVINTGDGGRRGSSAPAVSPKATSPNTASQKTAQSAGTATPAAAAEKAPASEPVQRATRPKSKKLDKRVAIGIAIGSGVLMLLLGVGVIMALMGGGGDEVAEKPASDNTNQIESAEQPDSTAVSEPEVNPAETNPEPAPAVTETNPEPMETAVAAATNPMPPVTTDSVANIEPKVEPAPPNKTEPEPKSEPKPEPAPEPKTEPKPEVKPEPKPQSKPEPAKEKPPAPAGNPLEKLPTVVALPEVPAEGAAAAPFEVGEIHLPNDALMFISLQGGETATRNKQKFTLANAGGGSDPRNWEVGVSGKPGDPNIVIAKLGLKDNKFLFQWTPEASTQTVSAQLSNCLLQLTAGKDARSVALRKPVEIEPVTVDLEKGNTVKFALENAPPGDYVKVEFVGLDPLMFPNPEYKPEASISADKGTTFLWFGDTPEGRSLGLKITAADKSKSIEVDLQPLFRVDAQSKEERMTKKVMPYWKGLFDQRLQGLTVAAARVDASKLGKEQKDQQKNLIDAEQKKIQAALENVTKAYDLHQKVHNQAVIHMRVFYDTGAGKVLLAQTTGAPDEAPPKAKPAEKKK